MKRKRKRRTHPVRILIILAIIGALSFFIASEIIEKKRNESIEEKVDYLPAHSYDFTHLRNNGGIYSYEDEHYTSSFGIDISEHNGDIDFEKVKEEGVEFVFIRVGYRGGIYGLLNKDKRFEEYYRGAKDAGLHIGFYFFSQAVDEKEAVEEADYLVSLVRGKQFDLPLVYDYEDFPDGRIQDLDGETRTENVKAFLNRIDLHGYQGMLYTNLYWLRYFYDVREVMNYPIWFAQYHEIPQYPCPFSIWQYSEEGELEGVEEKVDFNIMFIPK